MPLYSTLASLSQTAGSNAADGAVDAPSTIDQQLNLLASFIAQLRDGGPAFKVDRTSAASLTTATFTKVTLNSEAYDTGNFFDSTTNYRFQPTVAGWYHFDGQVSITNNAATLLTNATGVLYKNGSSWKTLAQINIGTAAASNFMSLSGSTSVFLNGSSDYVELWCYATAGGGSLTMQGSLEGYYVRP